jgi:hypothetical protein
MPSARVRFAGETAFLILVALGLGLAEFDPIVIGVVMFGAWVLVALLERASSKEAERAAAAEPAPEPAAPAPHVERIEVEPVAIEARPPEPEPAVSERSARAILASGPPPLPPEPVKAEKPKPPRRRLVERRPEPPPPPPPEPEPEPVVQGPPREWNLWELERAARSAPDEERQEERTALLIHLREFANADGDLPIEFDGLVRESFGEVLALEREPATAP